MTYEDRIENFRMAAFIVAEAAGLKDVVACDIQGDRVVTTSIVAGRPSFDVWPDSSGAGDLRGFTLMAFGGCADVACQLADARSISQVILLSAELLDQPLPLCFVDASQSVLDLGEDLDDSRLPAEFGYLSGLTSDRIPTDRTRRTEAFADVRVIGESTILTVPVTAPTLENIHASFAGVHGSIPAGIRLEIIKLHVRRTAAGPCVALPRFHVELPVDVPAGWLALCDQAGVVALTREPSAADR